MVGQFSSYIIAEFPEYLDLANLLELARQTWPRYGLSAEDLSEYDPVMIEMIKIYSNL